MEKLAMLAAVCALPAVIFMLVAKMNGGNKIIGWLGLKLPSLISLVSVILLIMAYYGFIKLS